MSMDIDNAKLKRVMEIIDEIAASKAKDSIAELEKELRELTGKADIRAEDCFEYWAWTSAEDLARTFLLPVPEYKGLTDDELAEIVGKICRCEYSEAEMDFQLKLLKKETSISNISDYIFYPDKVGLDRNADISEITAKILADRNKPILL